MRQVFETWSAKETERVGARMAGEAKAGDVIALHGDLGTGKTVFVNGFAKGLGVTEPVTSPTFTILISHESGRIPLHHFDVYRIGDPEEMEEIGFDEFVDGDGVTVIEWADQIEELLPPETRHVWIEKDLEKGFSFRKIIVSDGEDARPAGTEDRV